jgi:hypothetical protein
MSSIRWDGYRDRARHGPPGRGGSRHRADDPAVALGPAWSYLAPAGAAAGGLAVTCKPPNGVGQAVVTLGGVILVAIFVAVHRIQASLHNVVLASGRGTRARPPGPSSPPAPGPAGPGHRRAGRGGAVVPEHDRPADVRDRDGRRRPGHRRGATRRSRCRPGSVAGPAGSAATSPAGAPKTRCAASPRPQRRPRKTAPGPASPRYCKRPVARPALPEATSRQGQRR